MGLCGRDADLRRLARASWRNGRRVDYLLHSDTDTASYEFHDVGGGDRSCDESERSGYKAELNTRKRAEN